MKYQKDQLTRMAWGHENVISKQSVSDWQI